MANGDDWSTTAVYNRRRLGVGVLCDVCQLHFMPRGDCDRCPPATEDEPPSTPESGSGTGAGA